MSTFPLPSYFRLTNPKNGLSLSVSTDQLVVVMYTGNYLDKIRTGVCLETQNYPDSVNQVSRPVAAYHITGLSREMGWISTLNHETNTAVKSCGFGCEGS